MKKYLFKTLLALTLLAGFANVADAVSSYLNNFNSTYGTSGTVLNSCSLCHVASGPPARNPYGAAFANAGHNFRTIESLDSDSDTFSNIAEINARTFPGNSASFPAVTPPTCTSFTYSAWGACQSNGTQTRTVVSSSPAGCTGGTPVLSQSCTYVPPTCSYTYSAWGACQSNGTQTRTVVSSSPAGCTGTPVLSQTCTYVPPAPPTCTSFTYSAWGACQSNGTQTRTVVSSSPAGCTGGTPVLSQSCTYVPPTCSYTYSAWGACQSNGTQTRTVVSSSPAGCTGTPVLSQTCTYVPPAPPTCTSFTYSAWGACQSNGTQTRTVVSSSPAGCTGGTPVLSQSCTYVPPVTDGATLYSQNCSGCHGSLATSDVRGRTATQIQSAINNVGDMSGLRSLTSAQIQAIASALAPSAPVTCTSFTYSAWGACQSSGTQTRTVVSSSPAGCTGGTPVTSQTCTYVPPPPTACTYTYSAWGACQPGGTQTRTVVSSSPAGCTGTPSLSQTCTYVPPPTTETMPLPYGYRSFTYDPVAVPVLSTDPAQAKPIGVGPVANGGPTVDITVGLVKFSGPVDISFAIYASSIDSKNVYYLDSGDRLSAYSREHSKKRLVWRTTRDEVNEALFIDVPVTELPRGQYILTLEVRPSSTGDDDDDDDDDDDREDRKGRDYDDGGDNDDDDDDDGNGSYRWTTNFNVR